MEIRSIEDYLIDLINQKYAKRVFQIMNTEHEKEFLDAGKRPDYREYEWMKRRALEIHKQLNVKSEGEKDAEKAKD